MRINRFLANAGYGSRRDVEAIVRAGRVAINGRALAAEALHTRVGPGDAVRVGTRLAGVTPEGHIVTEHAIEGPGDALAARATLVRSLPGQGERLMAALGA